MEETVFAFDTNDLLVSDEAKWVQARKPTLMKVWRALRKVNHDIAPEEMFLDEANFSIFASFVYRWTDTDYIEVCEDEQDDDDEDSANDTEDQNDHMNA